MPTLEDGLTVIEIKSNSSGLNRDCRTSIHLVDLSHLYTYLLSKFLAVTVGTDVLVIIGRPIRIYLCSGSKESHRTTVALENVYGVFSVERVILAKFALALVQSHSF